MSNVARVAGQAANTLVKPLNVEDVFSTYLYTGNGTSQTITNGIDLAGEGGLVWLKGRDLASNQTFVDTERGATQTINSNSTATSSAAQTVTSFNSDGFSIGTDGNVSSNNYNFCSWTFRKAPKFFDVVTYNGNSVAGRTVSHNLGSVPGCIIVKSTSGLSGNWAVYHRSNTASPETDVLTLNTTNATQDNNNYWNDTAPTSTEFTLGGSGDTNYSGTTYVAYLFAHNDGDGEFGPDGDADIISCGSYTGNGSSTFREIDLGFEPQWVMVKRTDSTSDWAIMDNMRGALYPQVGLSAPSILEANTSDTDTTTIRRDWGITANGIGITDNHASINASGGTYIYIAIRRGPMAVPESATDVFAQDYRGSDDPTVPPRWRASFPVDFQFNKLADATGGWAASARLQGTKFLELNNTDAEGTLSTQKWDYMNGHGSGSTSTNVDYWSWMWKRAPNYFDVVAYTGNYTAGHNISHNLGYVPEMMWVKKRNAASFWRCYHKDLGNTKALALNDSGVAGTSTYWSNTTPTESVFTVGIDGGTNSSGDTFIAYLFASLAGVSKVGSYSGSASDQTIDCGFSSGARFVLIKNVSAAQGWALFDTERGIVAGNDPVLFLNATDAEFTSADYIDPHNSGFTLVGGKTLTNNVTYDYIFYAIA